MTLHDKILYTGLLSYPVIMNSHLWNIDTAISERNEAIVAVQKPCTKLLWIIHDRNPKLVHYHITFLIREMEGTKLCKYPTERFLIVCSKTAS